MAVEHMALVFEAEGLTGSQKLLLLAYANYTDPHGYCWPGVKRLAADTGASERTVIRTRKELEARNLLRHQRRTTHAGDPDTNLYRVNLDKLRALRRKPADFGDNVLAMEFSDEPPETTKLMPDTASDLLICQSDTTPPQSDTSSGQSAGGGPVRLTPPPPQIDTQSVNDPSIDPSVTEARARDGRTEAAPSGVTEVHREAATALVRQVDLSPVDAKPSQIWRVRDAVAGAFAAGYSAEQITVYLRSKLREARTVKYLCAAFTAHRLADIDGRAASQPIPPVCGHCDARADDPITCRTITDDDGRLRKCSRCHPHAPTTG